MVYAEIGARFNDLRETDKLQAFQYLQHALMEHMALLVPHAISAKDLLSTVAAIEEMLKGQSNSGRSPSEELRLWLNAPEPKRKGGRPKGSPNKPKPSPLFVPPVEQEPDFETASEAETTL